MFPAVSLPMVRRVDPVGWVWGGDSGSSVTGMDDPAGASVTVYLQHRAGGHIDGAVGEGIALPAMAPDRARTDARDGRARSR
jgi:hypothetical protein